MDTPFMFADVQGVIGRRMFVKGKELVDFAHCGYLGLDNDIAPADVERAKHWGLRNGWSRISGSSRLSRSLEKILEKELGFDCVRLAQSISLINHTLFYALGKRFSVVFTDSDAHITLKLGIKAGMDKSRIRYFENNDMAMLETMLSRAPSSSDPKLIVIDGIYSMKGTRAKISELLALCAKYNAYLLIDDAHGFGVEGKNGYGVVDGLSREALRRVIYVGSFNKCASNPVAFFAFSSDLAELIDSATPCLIYSGPPSNLHTIIAIRHFGSFKHPLFKARRRLLRQHSYEIHKHCEENGLSVLSEAGSPIIAVQIEPSQMEAIVDGLYRAGIFAKPAVFPVVRKGDEIIRFTVTALHTAQDIEQFKQALISVQGWRKNS
jgi:8-amino-7-oxononanoate synthase